MMAVMAAMPFSTHAQGAAPIGSGSETSYALEEVVVTAQKKEENLQHAAVAVDVVSAEALAKAGITTAAQLNQLVPSLTILAAGGPNTSYFVRGVGNFTNNGFSDPALAFSLDGSGCGVASVKRALRALEQFDALQVIEGTSAGS